MQTINLFAFRSSDSIFIVLFITSYAVVVTQLDPQLHPQLDPQLHPQLHPQTYPNMSLAAVRGYRYHSFDSILILIQSSAPVM